MINTIAFFVLVALVIILFLIAIAMLVLGLCRAKSRGDELTARALEPERRRKL